MSLSLPKPGKNGGRRKRPCALFPRPPLQPQLPYTQAGEGLVGQRGGWGSGWAGGEGGRGCWRHGRTPLHRTAPAGKFVKEVVVVYVDDGVGSAPGWSCATIRHHVRFICLHERRQVLLGLRLLGPLPLLRFDTNPTVSDGTCDLTPDAHLPRLQGQCFSE